MKITIDEFNILADIMNESLRKKDTTEYLRIVFSLYFLATDLCLGDAYNKLLDELSITNQSKLSLEIYEQIVDYVDLTYLNKTELREL